MQLYARHLRRSTPFEIERSIREFQEIMVPLMDLGPAYFEMWGPHEFLLTGTLADWDVTDRLGEIEAPALIVCGWYDEVRHTLPPDPGRRHRGQRVRHLRQLEPLHDPREGGRRVPRRRQGLRPPRLRLISPSSAAAAGSGRRCRGSDRCRRRWDRSETRRSTRSAALYGGSPPLSPTIAAHSRYSSPSGPSSSAASRTARHMSVLTSPGWIAFTVTPVPSSSAARCRVSWFSATLLVT